MAANAGLCVGGPFDGRQCAQPACLGSRMPIILWGAGPMHESEIKHQGDYFFTGAKWVWVDPAE